MYLSRLRLNRNRIATGWVANPYRVHQRLMMACEGDPRVLFRIEDASDGTHVLVQSHNRPHWEGAFADLPVLHAVPEYKPFEPQLRSGGRYRFRLLANPTVKKKREDGKPTRLGLIDEEQQRAWLIRKLADAGADLIGAISTTGGLQHSRKGAQAGEAVQTHYAVLFEGVLQVRDVGKLRTALETGIGSAKGFGFGLLSLAPA